MKATDGAAGSQLDPVPVLKGLGSLRRLVGTYPAGHPMIGQKLHELDEAVRRHLQHGPELRIDVIRGNVHLNGVAYEAGDQAVTHLLLELSELGVDSVHIREGIEIEELRAVAEFLWQPRTSDEPLAVQLAQRNVRHLSLGRLVALDTRWRSQQWPDAPTGPLDPAYAESLLRAQETFENTAAGKRLDPVTVRDLVQLLIYKVARSQAALSQILAVKQYENLTYCHSVNVAMLSLLLGRQLRLGDHSMSTLVEAALLHDIGKTRIPLDIVRKPGALTRRERKLMETHTTLGAEILVQSDGLAPLTPLVALEHHRSVKGSGYPDLGNAVPHVMSQIVSVADIYEAITGARSYQDPTMPERACLVLARLAGDKLNTVFVKAFVNAITFFPLGSVVRTSRDEIGVVIGTNTDDPLHPVIALTDHAVEQPRGRIDMGTRDASGSYERHIVETLRPPEGFDVAKFIAASSDAAMPIPL
jgi:putative nucleotidyltransferase with HDIG domain